MRNIKSNRPTVQGSLVDRLDAPVARERIVFAALGLVGGCVAVATLVLARGSWPALWSALFLFCVLPGLGVASWVRTESRLSRVLATLAVSLSWSTLVTSVLAGLQVLTVPAILVLIGGPGLVLSAAYLARPAHWSWPSRAVDAVRDPTATGLIILPGTISDQRRRRLGGRVSLFLAAACWLGSVVLGQGRPIGDYGLLGTLGWLFVLAVVLAVLGLFLSVNARGTWEAASALALLLLMLQGTPALFSDTPLSSWNYKHYGVVDYIVQGGPLSDSQDVYQQWPGFFAAAAGLVVVSGRSPLTYANWAALFFESMNALAIFGLAVRIARRSSTVPYVTVLLFITASWQGQRYYSPQSLAFLLALLFQYFMFPLLEPGRARFKALWQRRQVRARAVHAPPMWAGEDQRLSDSRIPSLVVGLCGLFLAMIVTHQLTPYVVFAGVVGLTILGVLRRYWVVMILGVLLIASFLWHLPALSRLPWFTGFALANAQGAALGMTSPQQELAGHLSRIIGLGLWVLAAAALLSYRRRMPLVAMPAVLAAAPFSLLLMQSYGGEGIYRVALFSAPWCAMVIAMRMSDFASLKLFRWIIIGSWSLFGFFGSAQATTFGMYPLIQVTPGEIAASQNFLEKAPTGSMLVLAASNFPSRLSAEYVRHNPIATVNDPSLEESPQYPHDGLASAEPHALAKAVDTLAGGDGYLVIGPAMYAYDTYYGVYTPGTLEALGPRLKTSRYWSVWYERDGVLVLEAKP